MFMDMSSELVHSLLPIFMASVLGASMLTIGFLEGVAEATAAITKIFSGALSDYLGKRKFLVVLGYGLAAVTKPVFPLAPSICLGLWRTVYRSDRQRHSRSASRRPGGGYHSARVARRSIRLAPVA